MLAQARVAHIRATRPLLASQKRLLATPPPNFPTPTSPVAPPTTQPAAVRLQPGASVLPPPTTAGALPPPPPPPPRSRGGFRKFLIYTTLGVLTFYPLSGWLSTQYEGYRDFFTENIPGGEFVADYADDHNWETFGAGTVSAKAAKALQRAKGDETSATAGTPGATKEEAAAKFREIQRKAEATGRKAESEAKATLRDVEDKASSAASSAKAKATETKDAVAAKAKSEAVSLREAASDAVDKVKAVAGDAKAKASEGAAAVKAKAEQAAAAARGKAAEVEKKAENAASAAKSKAAGVEKKAENAAASAKSKAVEAEKRTVAGVKGAAKDAEDALKRGEAKVEDAAHNAKAKVEDAAHNAKAKLDETPGPRGYLDAQRPRELRPETVTPTKPSYEGKTLYSGPPLPVGHEPPPGYYIPPPVVAPPKELQEKVKETLPLLAPKVKEFATEEPIVTQLASTIDSLTSSLSTPNSGDSTKILSKAQDDLNALTKRLSEVKKAEKANLEKTVSEKVKEFETVLKNKEQERAQGEQGLKENWEKEKSKLVEDWQSNLEKELESQRQGIEKRLREEVVSQGIELQRRWLRSIKTQVETERGGRLAKLDHLTTSLKQLERITLDNSATLDDNVRLHKVWSALRAVQAKAEAGDASFEDELRLLKSLSTPSQGAPDSIVSVALAQLDKSGIAQTGVKSFASLASWFSNSVSPRVHSAALVPAPEQATVLSHVASATFSKLMFAPKAGLSEGDDVSSTLARAEWCLGEKDLDGAAREVNSLKGWPAKLAEDWLREARRRLEVQQALEIVGAEATLGSLLLV